MLNKHIILPTFLGLTILLGGLTGCSGSKSSDASSSSTSNSSQVDPQQRAQKREEIRQQIEAVLTPEQKQQLQTKLQQGEKMPRALRSLNLSAEQKTKIQNILQTAYPHRQGQSKKDS